MKMALEDYRGDMEMCCRCSLCKFMPVERIKGYHHVNGCPSIARYNFHAYSGGGRLNIAVAMLQERLDFSDKLLEVVYNCQMCGACDVSCKYVMDMEVLEPLNELRIKCVEDGRTIPALDHLMKRLRKQGAMVPGSRAGRGKWAHGLDVKAWAAQKTEVLYHAGCRSSFDKELWSVARATVTLLQKAGVDVGIAGEQESCCGGRAYQMGYKADFLRQARCNIEAFEKYGVRTLVTGCADCYHAFKVLYDKFGMKGDLEVLHTAEYFDRLITEGRLRLVHEVAAKVTYHDPCRLGRLGEPYICREGSEVPGQVRIFDPPRDYRRGTHGVYDPPRAVLKSIPGLELLEMDRIKEYAWCCGAGGGVKEANDEFAQWTARQRIGEAESTGAQAIVTACPGCEQNFRDALKGSGSGLRVYDLVEVLEKATQEGGCSSCL
jgi:Fe-S oxidoreductase